MCDNNSLSITVYASFFRASVIIIDEHICVVPGFTLELDVHNTITLYISQENGNLLIV